MQKNLAALPFHFAIPRATREREQSASSQQRKKRSGERKIFSILIQNER
jgi:hypothetical protein